MGKMRANGDNRQGNYTLFCPDFSKNLVFEGQGRIIANF
jgi:hypothetical protein